MANAYNITNDILEIHNDKILFNQSLQYDDYTNIGINLII